MEQHANSAVKTFYSYNKDSLIQFMQLAFPPVLDPNTVIGCAVLEIYKSTCDSQIYITLDWADKVYTFPLDDCPRTTLQHLMEYIFTIVTEVACWQTKGYLLEFEDAKEWMQTPITEINTILQGTIKCTVNPRRTLDNHRWFVNAFTEMAKTEATIVHMCFTRLGIFFKNTYYVFSGTKADLHHAFDLLRQDIDQTKQEEDFGRGDHDEMLDMPLDIFCRNDCGCHTDETVGSKENYKCSHWSFKTFNDREELEKHINTIPLINWFQNEFIYL